MKKDYFVFTDSETIYGDENPNVHIIPQENLGWPGNTLYRFHMFLSQKEELEKFKYIFFLNANVECYEEIKENDFLPKKEGLLFVKHFNFHDKQNTLFSYERNSNSTAYIPMGEGKYYVCGGANGGKAKNYLDMCEELRRRIDIDDENGVTAIWHDESQINRYLYDLDKENKPYKILDPGYCFPEMFLENKLKNPDSFPYDPILLYRRKQDYINVNKIKGDYNEMQGNNKNNNKKIHYYNSKTNKINKGNSTKEEISKEENKESQKKVIKNNY
ncbi:glycosyltransferase family 6 protein [Piromyces sp. E2]|nr:glycosyltransferase family 6 protein [Piromyces sp. E2]|eukprot:OUM58004.1 glycosyltransferase family 6 protein [Piromyces sp. E2]